MALAHVYATVFPKNAAVLFVRVLDESGKDLKVASRWLTVTLAGTAQGVATVENYPKVPIKQVGPGPGNFTWVNLGSVTVEEPSGATTHIGVGELSPTVYAIEYTQPIDRGLPVEHFGATIVRV
jgi:hypothetical protein